jgi:hypothetical protein
MTSFAATTSRARRRLAAALSGALLALPVVAVAACGGPDGIEGKVVAVDAKGKGDRPLGGGWVAVLEDDALLDFLTGSGIDVPTTEDRPYLTGRVLHDDVTRAGGTLAPIDEDGKFALRVTGRHTVCRLVEAPQVDLLKGCAVVDLPADGTLTLSSGDSGLRAILDD